MEALLFDVDQRVTRALEVATDADRAWQAVSPKIARMDRMAPTRTSLGTAGAATERDAPPTDTAALVAWVRWLVSAYDLAEGWPACWDRHPGLVANLSGLRRWHIALTTQVDTNPAAVSSWHDALYRCNERWVRHAASRCLASHREARPLDGEVGTISRDPPH